MPSERAAPASDRASGGVVGELTGIFISAGEWKACSIGLGPVRPTDGRRFRNLETTMKRLAPGSIGVMLVTLLSFSAAVAPFRTEIVRAGLNYRFNLVEPVMAGF
jgi:hypothetical protein